MKKEIKISLGKEYKTISGLTVKVVKRLGDKYIGEIRNNNSTLQVCYCENGRANTVSEEYDLVREYDPQTT